MMGIDYKIAKRYLFGKKSTNAINVITGISMLGIAIGAAALVLILSVFNGFEHLISEMINDLNPDINITIKEGKTFKLEDEKIKQISELEGVRAISQCLSEIALFEQGDAQEIGVIKGVDANYKEVTQVDSTINTGRFILQKENIDFAIVGAGLANKLSLSLKNGRTPIEVFMPIKKKKSAFDKDFKSLTIYPSAYFSIQSEEDYQYMLASLSFVRKLLGTKDDLSSIEVALDDYDNVDAVKSEIASILGEDFELKDRYEQDEAFLKIMNIEKWMSFALVSLTLFLIAFNMIGCLWMIVLDKKLDIAILRAMGAHSKLIRNIFLWEGIFIGVIGLMIGLLLALFAYYLQKEFGIIGIAGGYIISAYPIELELTDFFVVAITVISIALMASFPAAIKAAVIPSYIREE